MNKLNLNSKQTKLLLITIASVLVIPFGFAMAADLSCPLDCLGTPDNDVITGTDENNIMTGQGGDDILIGLAGKDVLIFTWGTLQVYDRGFITKCSQPVGERGRTVDGEADREERLISENYALIYLFIFSRPLQKQTRQRKRYFSVCC